MKKWITMLLALLCLMAFGVRAEETPFTGYWELESLVYGSHEVSASNLSFGVTIVVREDGTLIFALAEDQFVTEHLTAEETAAGWRGHSTLSSMSALTIDDKGRLCFRLNEEMDVRMHRAEVPGDPVVGEWTIDHAFRNGEMQTRDTLRNIGLTVEPDQFGVLRVNDRSIGVRLFLREGELVVLRSDGFVYPATLSEDGQSISLDLTTTEGSAWTLVLVRKTQESSEAEEPATSLSGQSAEAAGFDGTWILAEVRMNDRSHAPADLGMEGLLRITGESARYTVGKENALGLVKTTESGLTLYCSSGEYHFTLNEAGQLCQEAQSFGLTLTLCFTRQP